MPRRGALRASGDPVEPFGLLDASGQVVEPAAAFLRELQACGRPATTQRFYGLALLRWFRFLGGIGGGIGPLGPRPATFADGSRSLANRRARIGVAGARRRDSPNRRRGTGGGRRTR